jgi:fructose 5-dehydrogenase small subunit
MASLTRRALLTSAVLLAPAARLRALARRPAAVAPTSLDEFLDLSQRLLGRSKLDPEIGQIYLDALVADADTAIYLATLVQSNGNPTPEQTAVAQTIVEWWYTGVYIVEGKSRLATHTGALMWSALGIPAPGTCAGPFGAWSRPPDTIA